jgi:hypothetical protein
MAIWIVRRMAELLGWPNVCQIGRTLASQKVAPQMKSDDESNSSDLADRVQIIEFQDSEVLNQ